MGVLGFLQSLDAVSILLLFWYTALLELPRYTIGGIIVAVTALWERPQAAAQTDLTLSILLVGHNEAHALRACVDGLAEQTVAKDRGRVQIIVVDDGSTDGMIKVARDLQSKKKIDEVLQLHHRGGKSAGVNLGISACVGDIIIIADIDTTFDRDAFEIILGYFADPRVGAVGGDIGVRNANASLITRFQAIEYAIGISLGRRIAELLGMLSIVSGAFGAFRRAAIESVGRQDVEVGEDADLTMKLRRAGWRIRFAPQARALTDVPATIQSLTAQRLRWDRGLVTIWMRKFRGELNPWSSTFRLTNMLALIEVIGFQVLLALAFPIYLVWLWYRLGEFAFIVIGVTLVIYFILDVLALIGAAAVRLGTPFRYLAYLPLYSVLQVSMMRVIRLIAIIQELVFHSSYRDPYVPARVMRQAERV
jgi:biofilm PGA synthesis N-glycosyltransferase PgaC